MKNILIIGCGLLGSSLVRRISKKKIAKKIFVYEKSLSNITKIKKLRLPVKMLKSLKDGVINSDRFDSNILTYITNEGFILNTTNFMNSFLYYSGIHYNSPNLSRALSTNESASLPSILI